MGFINPHTLNIPNNHKQSVHKPKYSNICHTNKSNKVYLYLILDFGLMWHVGVISALLSWFFLYARLVSW